MLSPSGCGEGKANRAIVKGGLAGSFGQKRNIDQAANAQMVGNSPCGFANMSFKLDDSPNAEAAELASRPGSDIVNMRS
jgi:hypothetical protein